MYQGKLVFSQIMSHVPQYEFNKCVDKYRGNYKVHHFSCWDHFLCLAFAQLTYRESLRDIVTCLNAMSNKLYHMGFRARISRSTLADANERRDWRIYAEFAQILIGIARDLYRDDPFLLDLDETVYALDSSTIDLCLSLFPWASFRKKKAAIKMHTLLDLQGNIPVFIKITDGKVHDVNILDELMPEPGAFYVMDRAYLDFSRLYRFHQHGAFFISRTKSNFKYQRIYSASIDKTTGLRCDQTIRLTTYYPAKAYPDKLRRIKLFDDIKNKHLTFLSNNFVLPAITITQLFKSRWQIELFFKWIKQHLRIKTFYGTSENAVKTQIWSAISVYLIVAIVKKRLNLDITLYTFLQILSISVFEKVHILQLVTENDYKNPKPYPDNQLNLFDL
jgi:hypothetical protein